MSKLYTIENIRLCWDYFQDGHFGLEGNPESFEEWIEQAGLHPAKMISDKAKEENGVRRLNLPPIRKKEDSELAVCSCRPNTDMYNITIAKCAKCHKEVRTVRTN